MAAGGGCRACFTTSVWIAEEEEPEKPMMSVAFMAHPPFVDRRSTPSTAGPHPTTWMLGMAAASGIAVSICVLHGLPC